MAGVSFSIDRGERVAFIGPNGAGKSTTIKMLTGILHPSSGSAQVLGLVPWDERPRLAMQIGTLFGQRSLLWPELPTRDTLRMHAAIYHLDRPTADERIALLSELLDAGDLLDAPVRTLSLGQRMRCELAVCLLHEPQLVFLDEPTIGLDLLAKQNLRRLLVALNEELGTTVFLTSHDVADIEHVADRAIVINDGRIIYDAPVATMRATFLATKRIEATYTHGLTPELTPRAGVSFERADAGTIRVDVDTTQTALQAVLDEVLAVGTITDLTVVDPPLETVIASIYGHAP